MGESLLECSKNCGIDHITAVDAFVGIAVAGNQSLQLKLRFFLRCFVIKLAELVPVIVYHRIRISQRTKPSVNEVD